MTVDLQGTALVIGAVFAGIPAVVTAYLQIKASRKIDKNKAESIAAREAQTQTIIQSAVTPALNAQPPVKDADSAGGA